MRDREQFRVTPAEPRDRQRLAWAEQQATLAEKTYLRLDCFAGNQILRKYYENAGYTD